MVAVEPVPGAPAAVADTDAGRALLLADYHAGIEAALRSEGVEVGRRADRRRERLLGLLGETDADRVVVLGDLATEIGSPGSEERAELRDLVAALPVELLVVRGNHDGDIEDAVDVTVVESAGTALGPVGVTHGHVWPAREVLAAEAVCLGHEHPAVRIEDEVGGRRIERVWLRGRLDPAPFEAHFGAELAVDADVVVFPAFNDLVGGTWVNVDGQDFLSPFLPAALPDGDAYLLDGTRLGRYRDV